MATHPLHWKTRIAESSFFIDNWETMKFPFYNWDVGTDDGELIGRQFRIKKIVIEGYAEQYAGAYAWTQVQSQAQIISLRILLMNINREDFLPENWYNLYDKFSGLQYPLTELRYPQYTDRYEEIARKDMVFGAVIFAKSTENQWVVSIPRNQIQPIKFEFCDLDIPCQVTKTNDNPTQRHWFTNVPCIATQSNRDNHDLPITQKIFINLYFKIWYTDE